MFWGQFEELKIAFPFSNYEVLNKHISVNVSVIVFQLPCCVLTFSSLFLFSVSQLQLFQLSFCIDGML